MFTAYPGTAEQRKSIPAVAGIGLRGVHHECFLDDRPAAAWLEAHSENYFAEGSVAAQSLECIRRDYPVSLHGVGLSLGSADPLNTRHLQCLKRLCNRVQPALVSEHLSWGSVDGSHLNDLLPLPYTEEALIHVVDRIGQVQDYLGRRILIENISSYLDFRDSCIPETEFLAAVAKRSGCGILLDINNVYVNAENHGFDAVAYIRSIPRRLVHEIHLAGHSIQQFDDCNVLIDTHDAPVCDSVWSLFETAVQRFGVLPTLIEWDSALPGVDVLLNEASKAQQIMDHSHVLAA